MTFDHKTHIRNNKGKVVNHNYYNMRVADGVKTYERPIQSGLWYYENGTPTPETIEKLKADTLKAAQAQRDAEAAMKSAAAEDLDKNKALTLKDAEIAKLKEQLEKATSDKAPGQEQAQSVASNKKS